jgi:hypothetical protein
MELLMGELNLVRAPFSALLTIKTPSATFAESSRPLRLKAFDCVALKRFWPPVFIALFLCTAGDAQQTQKTSDSRPTSDPVVMTVADRHITVSELCSALGSLPPPQRKGYALHPALAKDWYGPLIALAEEAKREHVGGSLEAAKLSEVDLNNALVGELIQNIASKTQPSESEIRNYYKAHHSNFEQVKARHILISDATALASRSQRTAADAKTKAEELASELRRGADFAVLAATDSDDPYTKDKGGDLGYVSHHELEPAVDSALWSLQPRQVSAPIEGRFGYEIVKVEGRRTRPLDEVRESIVGTLKAAAVERRQQEIVAAAHVSMDPAFADAPLPCEAQSQSFTLKDPLRLP